MAVLVKLLLNNFLSTEDINNMSKLKYQTMTQKELRDYVLTHREDVEAFHAYVDKLNAEGNWVEMAPVESMEELENNPELIQHFRDSSDSELH